MAHEDSLTGLSNRRYFDQHLSKELERAKRTHTPISLILLDVDEFKRYNDRYGHSQGDLCLQRVAAVLKAVPQRPGDFVSRYGGEEFVCILSDTHFQGAMFLAEQICQDIAQLAITHDSSTVVPYLTVSVGVQTVEGGLNTLTPDTLFTMCDKQLYLAKAKGRNQVCGHHLTI